jgi:hypothetical protein
MANTKISQLPLYSGSAADLRWFVMNNSGETETFKYSGFSTSITFGTGTDSIKSTKATASGTNSIAIGDFTAPRTLVVSGNDAIGIGSTDGSQPLPNDMIMIGHRTSQQASTRGVVVGTASQIYSNGVVVGSDCSSQSESIIVGNSSRGFGYRNINIGHSITFNTGTESIAIGSAKSILNVGDYEMIIGGQSTTMTGTGNHQTLIGGQSNTIGGTTSYSTILGGKDNTNISSSYSSIIGGEGNNLNAASYAFIGGGKYNILSGGTNYSSIVGGLSNENYGNYSGIFNGTLNQINNPATEHASIIASYSSRTEGDHSHIFGGLYNQIFNQEAIIIGGQSNIINNGASQAEIIGSRNCIINGTTADNTIINSISSVIPNAIDRAVMLGTSGRTATTSSATFVENLVVFNYAALDFANDTAAAAGGVVLGQIYHTAGVMKIRII